MKFTLKGNSKSIELEFDELKLALIWINGAYKKRGSLENGMIISVAQFCNISQRSIFNILKQNNLENDDVQKIINILQDSFSQKSETMQSMIKRNFQKEIK